MKKVVLIFLSFFFIAAIPAFADTSGGYGGTDVTVIDASNGGVEIQNLQCSAYSSFQLRLESGGSDLAHGATCSQNGSNADVTWSTYDFTAHGPVTNYIVAESFSTGTDFSNTFTYGIDNVTHGGNGGTTVSVINASAGEVEIQNLQCSNYNSFQLRISGNNNYGDLASAGTCSQNGSNADVTWSSWDFTAHGAVSNYTVGESFTFGTDYSNTFSYASNAGTNVSVINASAGEVEIQNLVCSAYSSFQLRLNVSNTSDLAHGGVCSQNGNNADVTWSSFNFNTFGAVSNYIVAESFNYGSDFSNTFSYTPSTFSISGNVFNDANHNGVKDSGESNYSGATVALSGASSASATTDTNGNYTFSGLASGSYTVTLTDPTGYGSTTTNPINLSLNSNTTENFGIISTTKLKLTPIADDLVSANNPTANYGTLDYLRIDTSPEKISYLKYDLSSLAGKTITSVRFKVTTYSDANSTTAGPDYVYLVNDTSWGETTLNYNNRPAVSSTLLGTLTNLTSTNTQYDFQLDPTGIQPKTGGLMSVGITSGSTAQLHIYSREATSAPNTPKLVIDYY